VTALRPVTRDHVGPLIRLKVAPHQDGFVAPNAVSLAQAPYETGAFPFAICDGETPVGYLALIDMRIHDFREDGDDPNSAYLWRLMIGADHQKQGHATAALVAACDWCTGRGLPRLFTSAVPENGVVRQFYQSQGFTETGRVTEGEVEYMRPIA